MCVEDVLIARLTHQRRTTVGDGAVGTYGPDVTRIGFHISVALNLNALYRLFASEADRVAGTVYDVVYGNHTVSTTDAVGLFSKTYSVFTDFSLPSDGFIVAPSNTAVQVTEYLADNALQDLIERKLKDLRGR